MTDPFEEFEQLRRFLQPIDEADRIRQLSEPSVPEQVMIEEERRRAMCEPSALEQAMIEEERRRAMCEPSALEQAIIEEERRRAMCEPSALEQAIIEDARRLEALRCQLFDADGMLGTLESFRSAMFDFVRPVLDTSPSNVEPLESANARQSVTQLIQEIKDFEQGLDADREVGVCFASAAGSDIVHVTSVRFSPPNLVVFGGYTDAGLETRVIHHVSQTKVQLVAVPVLREKTRIGFSVGSIDGDD